MRYRATIGIEISAGEVRGACIRSAGGSVELAGAVSLPIPPGGKDTDGFLNVQEVGDAVRRVCAQLDPRASSLVVGVTDCSLVARVMEIPPVPDADVRPVLRGEMDHYRILPAGQSAFDYYRLPDPPEQETDAEESASARVLLIGAEERLVASYRAVADATSLNLVAVEPGSIAVLRALYPMIRHEAAVATVTLSTTGTDVLITQDGALQFYRRIDTGLHELYAREAAADPAAAPAQQRGPLLVSYDDGEPEPVEPVVAADKFNRQAISLLMTEVQRSIDYFKREYPTAGGHMLVRFVINREDAAALFSVLAEYLRSDAELASPFDRLPVALEAAEAVRGPQGVRFTVAVGLALRGCGGEYAGTPALDLGVGDRVIVDRRMAPRLVLVSAAATGFILVGTVVAALLVGTWIGSAERSLLQTRHELDALTREHAEKVARLERQKNLIMGIKAADKPIREGIEYLSGSIARTACLTGMTIDTKGVINLSGEAVSPQAVADIMDTINVSPSLEPVRLESLARLDPNGEYRTVTFQMATAFAPPQAAPRAAAPQPAAAPGATAAPQPPPTPTAPQGGR